jgi:sec-independent protein translocase protein TatC
MALVPFPSQSAQRRPDDEPDWDEDPDDGSGGKMSFLEHLDELRKRIIWSVSALGVGVLIAFAYIGTIFEFIMRPMQRMLPPGQTLIYTDPSEAFML